MTEHQRDGQAIFLAGPPAAGHVTTMHARVPAPPIPLAQWLLLIATLCSALVPWGAGYAPAYTAVDGNPEMVFIAGWKVPEFRFLATLLIVSFWLSSIERQNRTDGRFFHRAFFLVNLAGCVFLMLKLGATNSGWPVPIVGLHLFLLFSSLHYAAAAMLSPRRAT